MLYVRALHFAIGVFLLNQVVSVIPRLQATSAQVISSHLYYGRVSHISGESDRAHHSNTLNSLLSKGHHMGYSALSISTFDELVGGG